MELGRSNLLSKVQVAVSKNSDHVQNFSLRVAGEDSTANLNFSKLLELSEMCRSRKLILGVCRLGLIWTKTTVADDVTR